MANKKIIRYGIIGCGKALPEHAEAIQRNTESKLAAVFDIDGERAARAAIQYGCEKKTSAAAILGDANIDAVIIATPHDTHKNLVLRTIRAGKYAICEKPLVLSAREGRAILKSKYYKRNVFTVFQTRFNPVTRFLFRLISSGQLGEIQLCNVQVYKYRDRDYFREHWRKSQKRSGGMLLTQGIHALDIMRIMCGWPKKIITLSKNYRPHLKQVKDVLAAAVEFRNGALGSITVSTAARHKNYEHSIFIAGSRGSMGIGGHAFEKIINLDPPRLYRKRTVRKNYTDHERFLSAVNDFILRKKRDPLLPFAEDGVSSTAFAEAIFNAQNHKSKN